MLDTLSRLGKCGGDAGHGLGFHIVCGWWCSEFGSQSHPGCGFHHHGSLVFDTIGEGLMYAASDYVTLFMRRPSISEDFPVQFPGVDRGSERGNGR